jgi:competence protein ComEA
MYRTKHLLLMLSVMALAVILAGSAMAEGGNAAININTATIEELVQLERVGPKYAERIVAFREQNGPFEAPEDIMQVAGIGPKTFEANKDRIVVK